MSTYPVDSDTFLASNLQTVVQKLDENIGFMHTFEYKLSGQNRSKTTRGMCSVLNGKVLSDVVINQQSEMWNAGMIAFPKTYAKAIINLSLTLCDAICETPSPVVWLSSFTFLWR